MDMLKTYSHDVEVLGSDQVATVASLNPKRPTNQTNRDCIICTASVNVHTVDYT